MQIDDLVVYDKTSPRNGKTMKTWLQYKFTGSEEFQLDANRWPCGVRHNIAQKWKNNENQITIQVWRVRGISAWYKSMTLWSTTQHRPEMEKQWKPDYNTSWAGPRNFSLMQIYDPVVYDITSPRNGKQREADYNTSLVGPENFTAWCKSMTLWCTT